MPSRWIILAGVSLALAACHSSIKEIEPSEAFRRALDEVMLRQPNDRKVQADDLHRRREPVVLRLSFDDCLELAMAHNRAILFERLNAELAAADVVAARANLDFRVGASAGYIREESQIDARFAGDDRSKEISNINNYGVTAVLPFATGTTVELQGGFQRRSTNSPFQTFDFFPSATLFVRQQLLDGLGFVPNLGDSWIAEGEKRIADWQVDVTRNHQAFEVSMAYWNLVEAQQELEVLREREQLANEALALARSRLEAEIGTRLEVLAQEANLSAQQVEIIRAEAMIEQRIDELLYAIHPDMIHGYALFSDYRIVIEPTTGADTARSGIDDPALIEEVKAALRRRPEIRQAMRRVQNAGIAVEMGEYRMLPSLEVEGEFGNRGAGTEIDDALENFGDFRNLRYGVRANFSVPLQNSAGRAGLMRAELQKRAAILAAREAETMVILEVAQAVRDIRTARRAIAAAEEAQRLQSETYEAEFERQRAGLATPFEVRQAQNELTAARLELVKARIGLERSRLALQRATGELGR